MPNLEGQILKGRYRIEELVGRGGMAEVYKAWDTHRQYHVAIKVMREDLAEDIEFLRRFKREASSLAALSHANVVRFYSFEREKRLAFIVMDYVEGTTLRGRILDAEGAPLPLDEVASIVRQVCAALHYAHTENVLHRDVKPGNIMIQPDPLTGTGGRVLLSDFGIAKAADAATATTVMPGTPAYMSPEQCRSEVLDLRTDIYSLGVVLYEMLAGRRPFVGDTEATTGSTREKLRWEQMHADPPPLRQVNPQISPELEAIVLRCLAKEREERYGSVLALLHALEKAGPAFAPERAAPIELERKAPLALEPEPPTPPPPSRAAPEPAPRPANIPAAAWAVGGVILVGLLIAAAVHFGRGPVGALLAPPTATPTATNTPTATPRPPMATPVPTATSPPPAATLAPPPVAISPDNAAQVAEWRTLSGHTSEVQSVAFSPDGTILASGALDKTVRLWRVSDGGLLHVLDGHTSKVWSVAFSPDGATLASGSQGEVRLWRVSDGELLHALEGHTGEVYSVAFSPDGAKLASGSQGEVRLWRVSNGELLHTLEGHTGEVYSVAFSPDGATLASGSGDGTVRLWQVSGGMPLSPLSGHAGYVYSVAFSPDGATLASGSFDKTIQLREISNGSLLHTFTGHTGYVYSVAFSPDGAMLASGSGDGTVRLWRVSDETLLHTLSGHTSDVQSVAFSPDGTTLASGSWDDTVRLWRVSGP